MRLEITKNKGKPKVTHDTNLNRLFKRVHSELQGTFKGCSYVGDAEPTIVSYNTPEQAEFKIHLTGYCHVCSLRTENEVVEFEV